MEDRLEALEKQVKKLKKKVKSLEARPIYVYPSTPYYVPFYTQPAFQLRPFTQPQPYYPYWTTSAGASSIGQSTTTITAANQYSLTAGESAAFD